VLSIWRMAAAARSATNKLPSSSTATPLGIKKSNEGGRVDGVGRERRSRREMSLVG
jgi:hypothetical protein